MEIDQNYTFTCLSCHVAFSSSTDQRQHHSSDWHRYNLKRKVINLEPINETQFNALVPEKSQESKHLVCTTCSAEYTSQKLFNRHTKKKTCSSTSLAAPATTRTPTFPERIANATSEAEIQAIIDEKIADSPRLDPDSHCLFCHHASPGLDQNLAHMEAAHSFFLPDKEYLIDVHGLVNYLGTKISVSNTCLYCNGAGKAFYSLDAVRKHMAEKGHSKMLYLDNEDEYLDFYDYSLALEDNDWESVDGSTGAASGDEDVEYVSLEEDDVEYVTRKRDIAFERVETGTGLVLPSGLIAGHRSLNHIWRQYIPDKKVSDAVLINRMVVSHTRGGGLVQWRAKEEQRATLWQKKMQSRAVIRKQQNFNARVGQKANGLQKHYREQNPI